MHFYQKGIARFNCIFITMTMDVIAFRLLPYIATTPDAIGLMLTALVSFNILMVFVIRYNSKKIKIDETGITCFRKKRTYWSIDWGMINCLSRTKNKGCICVSIITKEHSSIKNSNRKINRLYYFQWCESGKAAIKKYAPPDVKKL